MGVGVRSRAMMSNVLCRLCGVATPQRQSGRPRLRHRVAPAELRLASPSDRR
ncbi:MAG: hypothetical protein MZV49_06420 [Rhodopseudomonas palustris]|nr:hypothetical protein [Rhodopseudomonas palustris]